MAKAPAFQLYPADLLADPKVAALDDEAFGVYCRLLCLMWLNGGGSLPQCSLPDDPHVLALMMKRPKKKFEKIWRQLMKDNFEIFDRENGLIVSRRLHKERIKQEEMASKRKVAAEARWSKCNASAMQVVCSSSSSSSSSSRQEDLREEKRHKKPPIAPLAQLADAPRNALASEQPKAAARVKPSLSVFQQEQFDQFWESYPRKVGKGAAILRWAKIKPDRVLHERIIAAVERQRQSQAWMRDGGQYIPNPATWLNQQRWDDELEDKANDPFARLRAKYGEGK